MKKDCLNIVKEALLSQILDISNTRYKLTKSQFKISLFLIKNLEKKCMDLVCFILWTNIQVISLLFCILLTRGKEYRT